MKKILIAYYSFSGTTRLLAEQIAAAAAGTLREIRPAQPYAFDYHTAVKEARAEIARGFCPKLMAGHEPIREYEVVFVGTPNWFKSLAPPVLAFLRGHDFGGKTLVPFCSHGGGGWGEIAAQLAQECPGAKLLPGLAVGIDGAAPAQIAAWLQEIGLQP